MIEIKKIRIVLIFIIGVIQIYSMENVDYREEMRKLVLEIRDRKLENQVIVTQNATNLFFEEGKIIETFFNGVDGIAQESLIYGVGGKNMKTPKEEKKELLDNLIPLRERGKPVFSVNYGEGDKRKKEVKKNMKKYNFIGELVPDPEANIIFLPIEKSEMEDVNHLSEVKNFLYLLNPEKFKNLEEYFKALDRTDVDLLIIEPHLKGKILDKSQIEKLKTRKNGTKRLVIGYLSLGEGEDYRKYWKKTWKKEKPHWIMEKNPHWAGSYRVKYWDPEWKEIVKQYQESLKEIGLDGYYLDTLDTYYYFEKRSITNE
ncbi:MAG: endo alpha-1,4 polygalactosaminidase [Fusobacteriaceae bacterium]